LVHVAPDELGKPLGLERPKPRHAVFRLPPGRVVTAIVGLVLVAAAGYVALATDPLGGEPHAVVSIRPAPGPADPAAVVDAKGPGDAAPQRARATAEELETAAGVSVVRPGGGAAPESVVVRVPQTISIRLNPAPDRRLVERTRHGSLPKIGAGGARPADVYARPAGALASGAAPAGRVAIVVGGLGISQGATADAIAKLPNAVTLAFAPYGSDLEKTVARARDEGHEVMLQVPMEPFDYPDNDPGPHTLTVQAKPAENVEKLHWLMGRFAGYVGVMNFMGARLTSDETAFAPVLKEIGERGLVFLDDGSSSRSLVETIAPVLRADARRADFVLDAVTRADAIDKELARLETTARERGLAIGTATALPLTVERIARWARTLEAKGILLVPASSVIGHGKG